MSSERKKELRRRRQRRLKRRKIRRRNPVLKQAEAPKPRRPEPQVVAAAGSN